MPSPVDMMASSVLTSKDMPHVKFDVDTIEDVQRTKEDGVMRFKDQHYAIVTPPGGKSNNIYKVEAFFKQMKEELKAGRVLPEWIKHWEASYDLYKKGQEIPLEGTPIRGWKLMSGSQQEECIRFNILTVEQLANLTDEGMRNVGMGALQLKRRAQAWLAQNEEKEGGAVKLTALQRENDTLKETVENLSKKVEFLASQLEKQDGSGKKQKVS